MNPPEFVAELRRRGVVIEADARGGLRFTAPKGLVKGKVEAYLRAFRPQLAELLRREHEDVSPPESLSVAPEEAQRPRLPPAPETALTGEPDATPMGVFAETTAVELRADLREVEPEPAPPSGRPLDEACETLFLGLCPEDGRAEGPWTPLNTLEAALRAEGLESDAAAALLSLVERGVVEARGVGDGRAYRLCSDFGRPSQPVTRQGAPSLFEELADEHGGGRAWYE